MKQDSVQKKVRGYCEEQRMLQQKDRVLLGLSGGADSVCLLFALLSLKEEYELTLKAVHIHHGIRGEEADNDAEFVKELCEKMNVEVEICHYDVPDIARRRKLSEEEAGREVRYQTFLGISNQEGYQKIAVAHHRDDQAETVIQQMCRGSGLSGLSGMKPISGNIIRPLLCVSRREVEQFLVERGVTWRMDSTNYSNLYQRNRLRNQIMPLLKEYVNPCAAEHIAESARQLAEVESYLKRQARAVYERDVKIFLHKNVKLNINHREGIFSMIQIERETFLKEDVVIQKEVIKQILSDMGGLKDIMSCHIESVVELLHSQAGKYVCLPGRRYAMMEYQTLNLYQQKKEGEKQERTGVLLKPGDVVGVLDSPYQLRLTLLERDASALTEKFKKKEENTYTKWFDYDKIKGNLQLRTRQPGDYICIGNGKHKKMNRYLIDEKVPARERDNIMLLADGNHILWVLGYRSGEGARITEKSCHILMAELIIDQKDGEEKRA